MIKDRNIFLIFICICFAGLLLSFLYGGAFACLSFFVAYIIILIDLILLVRNIKKVYATKSTFGNLSSILLRWAFVTVLIVVSLVVLKVDKPPFLAGIVSPFIGVIIIGIYQIFWGKEDGTSS